jgi:hypothetical protein
MKNPTHEPMISAPPGYGFLMLSFETDENGALAGSLELVEALVIGWRIWDDGTVRNPVLYGSRPENEYDSALELPDGRCISDSNEIYPDRAAWIKNSTATFEEAKADDQMVISA